MKLDLESTCTEVLEAREFGDCWRGGHFELYVHPDGYSLMTATTSSIAFDEMLQRRQLSGQMNAGLAVASGKVPGGLRYAGFAPQDLLRFDVPLKRLPRHIGKDIGSAARAAFGSQFAVPLAQNVEGLLRRFAETLDSKSDGVLAHRDTLLCAANIALDWWASGPASAGTECFVWGTALTQFCYASPHGLLVLPAIFNET